MARDIYELIQREYGVGHMQAEPGRVGVAAVAATQILKQDPTRVSFVFMNLSANTLGILPRGDLALTNRSILVAAGGLASFNWRDDLVLPALEWFVVGTAAAEAWMVVSVSIDDPGADEVA